MLFTLNHLIKIAAVPVVLIALALVLVYEAKQDAGTYDEIAHITAGYTYVYQHDFRLYPDNPPLIKMISVLPWLPIKQDINFPEKSQNWNDPKKIDQWSLGTQFLYQSGNDADMLIFLARIPIIMLTVSLGLLIFSIAKYFYSFKAGILALILFSLSPDIRAHGHLSTTDVGATFFALLASFLLYLSFIKKTTTAKQFARTVSSGIFFAFAILSKYSMILAFLCSITILIVYLIVKSRSRLSFIKLVIILCTSYITLWAFSFMVGYTKETLSYKNVPMNKSAQQTLNKNIGWKLIHAVPLPYYYQTGLETMYTRNIITQPTYLLGLVIPKGGSKLFFPLSYILKTPIPVLLLLISSVVMLIINKSYRGLLPFFLGAAFFISITAIGNLTIGTRFYYLATVLFIITASAVVTKKIGFPILTALLAWLIVTNVFSFPYDISYVNEIGGGTKNGYNSLVDSSYDWGQDLKRLATWYKHNGHGKEIKLSYLGTADPKYYGIKYKPLKFTDLQNPKGLIAISVTNLKLGGTYIRDRYGNTVYDDSVFEKIKNKKPLTRVGTTIFVYEF